MQSTKTVPKNNRSKKIGKISRTTLVTESFFFSVFFRLRHLSKKEIVTAVLQGKQQKLSEQIFCRTPTNSSFCKNKFCRFLSEQTTKMLRDNI